ncbi:hypothetical protein GCM10023159_15880 [Brevibacterium yomogidense]
MNKIQTRGFLSRFRKGGRQTVRRGRLAIAFVTALTLILPFVFTSAGDIAHAATPGVSVTVDDSGQSYDGTEVVGENDTMAMRVQYESEAAGSTVAIELSDLVEIPGLPGGNSAISSIERDPDNPNVILITFVDEWPSDVNQGVLRLDFVFNEVEKSSHETLTWTVDGEEASREIIIRNEGDNFANVSNSSHKGVTNHGGIADFITITDKVVSIDEDIIGAPITYVLNVSTEEAQDGYSITDQLPDELVYIEDSFALEQTSWDEDGLNQ